MEIAHKLNPQRKNDLQVALVSLGILLLCLVVTASNRSVQLFGFALPPLCGFRIITGLDCPGCGLVRSLILAFHGRYHESYLLHIWGIPLAAILLFQIPYRLFRLAFADSMIQFPAVVRHWFSYFVVLSFLLPWAAKTVVTIAVMYG